jgi:arabinofuranan 3-O-arabinosyltransferase
VESDLKVESNLDLVSVTVVIPAFNEARRLPISLPVLSHALRTLPLPSTEVIVVDDGSIDDTARIAAELLRDVPNSRVISLSCNAGKGAAVRAGVEAATGEAIVFMDADLASDIADLPALLAALEHAEVALGSRRLGPDVNRDLVRRLGSSAFNWIARSLVPLDVADTQCGFKAFRRAEAKILFGLSRVSGFAFDVEVLAIARSLGYRIAEVPVRWEEKPDGTFRAARHTPGMLADLVRARRHVVRAGRQAAAARNGEARPPRELGADAAGRVRMDGRRGASRQRLGPGEPDEPSTEPARGTPALSSVASSSVASSAQRAAAGPRPGAAAGARPAAARTARWHLLWLALGFAALCLAQRPGKVTADTEITLALNPARFLLDATHLWNSRSDFGFIPDQYTGYLFPMGPFFLAGHLLGVPVWITQRLWMALVLTVAAWGIVRLADALRIGRPVSRLAGGLGYALSPMFLGKIGAVSAALLGAALIPWMLVPLLRSLSPGGADTAEDAAGARRGADRPVRRRRRLGRPVSPAAETRLSPLRAAALSGLAVLCVGGINATVTLAALVCPALLLVFAGGGRRVWALRAWWLVAVALATAWWVVGLLTMSRYGLNFLPFTESADTTTATTSATETLRGATDWLAYLRLPAAWLPALADYEDSWVAIAGSVAVAAIALWGLARRDLPARRFLVVTFGVGVVATAVAYPGVLGGPFSAEARDLLAGPLAPLRNVFKFEPIAHLPMALGLTHALHLLGERTRRPAAAPTAAPPAGRPADLPAGQPAVSSGRRRALAGWRRVAARGVAVTVAVAAVAAGMGPVLDGDAFQAGSFTAVPGYWKQAADWLAANPDGGHTLLLPATAFGEYSWGRPLDEPMQWLASTPWGVRSLIPLGSVGLTRWMDAVETSLSRGDGTGLAAALARAGVGQVLIRNDLSAPGWDVPPSTSELGRALAQSGLREAAAFGPGVPARLSAVERSLPASRRPAAVTVPALQVWTVPGGASAVTAYPAADALVVSGGPEATVQLAAHGLLPADRAVVLAGDLGETQGAGAGTASASAPTTPAADVLTPTTGLAVTDTFDRRDIAFGLVHGSASYLLGPNEDAAGTRAPPRQWTDRPPAGHETVAGFAGGKSVTASSYGYLLGGAPQLGPASAVDGLPYTWWTAQADPKTGTEGAWLRVDVGSAVSVPYLQVQLLAETSRRSVPQVVRVTTAAGSVDTPVARTEQPQHLAVPPGRSSWYQVTLLRVTPQDPTALGAGIRELTVPGQTFERYAQVPGDATGLFTRQASSQLMYAFDRERADLEEPFSSSEEQSISRRFTTPRAASFTLTGTAVIVGQQADAAPPQDGPLLIDCGQGPEAQIDGATYQLRIEGRTGDAAAARPLRVTVCTPGGTVPLSAGAHQLTVPRGSSLALVDTLSLVSTDAGAPSAAARTTKAGQWTAERRTVQVGPGAAAFLAVHENANQSWTATLDGVPLRPVRLDGWQQGWVVPAGAGGTVVIENHPGVNYRRGLLVGLALVLVLLAAALIPARRRPRRAADSGWRDRPEAPVGPSRLPSAAIGGPVGWWGLTAAGTLAVLLVAGPFALAVPVLAVAARHRGGLLPWCAAVGMTGSGVVMLVAPGEPPSTGLGAFSGWAQAAAAFAVAATVAALAGPAPGRGKLAGGPTAPGAGTSGWPSGATDPAGRAPGAPRQRAVPEQAPAEPDRVEVPVAPGAGRAP